MEIRSPPNILGYFSKYFACYRVLMLCLFVLAYALSSRNYGVKISEGRELE
jgi:hypothetical protein